VFQSVAGIRWLVPETTIGYLVKTGCRTCRIKPPSQDHLHCSTGMVIEGQAIIECGDRNERQREAVNPVEADTFGVVVVQNFGGVAVTTSSVRELESPRHLLRQPTHSFD
jgi:hypothetical protein